MKKLIIAAAAVAMGIAANAANCDWGIDLYSYGTSDEYWDGKTYYAFNGDASSYVKMLTDGNVAGFKEALGNGEQFTEWSYGAAAGTVNNAGSTISVIALTDNSFAPDSTFYYASGSTAGMTYAEGQQSPGQVMFSADAVPSPWSSATVGNVPEPTSGLLLLLGVAGLALRRRRA